MELHLVRGRSEDYRKGEAMVAEEHVRGREGRWGSKVECGSAHNLELTAPAAWGSHPTPHAGNLLPKYFNSLG